MSAVSEAMVTVVTEGGVAEVEGGVVVEATTEEEEEEEGKININFNNCSFRVCDFPSQVSPSFRLISKGLC